MRRAMSGAGKFKQEFEALARIDHPASSECSIAVKRPMADLYSHAIHRRRRLARCWRRGMPFELGHHSTG